MFTDVQKNRILKEEEALQELCRDVQVDLRYGYVQLNGYPFPRGWNADRSNIRYDLPPSYWQEPPTAWVPEDLRYRGDIPELLYDYKTKHGYRLVCLHIDDFGEWEPDCHSMVTVTRCVNQGLRHPDKRIPWRHR